MDISNEATVDSFFIGPSTIIGRTIAFRILFCNSIAELKQKIIGFLWIWLTKFRKYVRPFVSWLHPRNPPAILSIVILTAFLLKRNSNGKSTAQSGHRRKLWANIMRNACTYDEWVHAARMLDIETPEISESNLYDEELVRNKLHELSRRRQEGSLREIMFHMRADLLRNLGNMCNPHLHQGRYQVPRLINRYIDEVSTQLRMVCYSESDELLLEEKLTFMHETRHAFGRTALLLSGGASLGSFHVGVVQTLIEHKLLPQIIAGSSVGSIICSIVATRSSPELQSFFENSLHSLKFFDRIGGIFTVVRRIITLGAVHEIRQLQNMLRDLTSNLTFQEAYDLTGQILCITVSSMRKHEPPRCLNYLTSPHVVIWSAVTASCAFPGLFEAQELMAKDRNGELIPYHTAFKIGPGEASGYAARRWRDGSLESDLPMLHLKELFNVNHFIVSQANPHITPLLRFKELIRSYGGDFAARLAHLAEMEVKHRFDQMLELGFPLGGLAKLFSQEWEGDVTIVMPTTLAQYSKLIQNLSRTEIQKAEDQGRKCTWEKFSAIKANCSIEHALDECVSYLNHLQRLKRGTKRASASSGLSFTTKSGAWRRIPSWNCLARENSWESLDDEALVDVGFNQGGQVNRNMGFNRSKIHDGSDSETESIDINISWTRSGGPLMRTDSATNFVNSIKNVNIDDEEPTNHSVCEGTLPHLNTDWPEILDKELGKNNRDLGNKVPATASSILVSEGYLLQPERTHNGFVLSVVKKKGLALASKRCDPEKYQGSSEHIAKRVQLDNLGKEMESYNVSSPPAYGDEDDGISGEHFDEMGCKNLFF